MKYLLGYPSYRHEVTGSVFIRVLCEVFEEHAHDTPLTQLILLVQQKLSKEEVHVQTGNGHEVVRAGIVGDPGCNTLEHDLYFDPAMSFKDWIMNGMRHELLPERTNT